MIVIDGEGKRLGRLASYVAQKLLANEQIYILNTDKVIVVGTKDAVLKRYIRKGELRAKGNAYEKGPKHYKTVRNIFKQAVKRMLPYKSERGRAALRRLKVYSSWEEVPENILKAPKEEYNEGLELKTSYLTLAELEEELRKIY
jgi:large subunit ribosomal protein L13